MRIARRMMQNQTYCSESAAPANAFMILYDMNLRAVVDVLFLYSYLLNLQCFYHPYNDMHCLKNICISLQVIN